MREQLTENPETEVMMADGANDEERMRPKVRLLAFTDAGLTLAQRIAALTDGEAQRCGNEVHEGPGLYDWTEEAFIGAKALIYVGAAGIAVRAIAPFLRSKAADPAVLVVDETGRYVIPILSGHLGGANSLALELAEKLGAEAVITTATDRHGVFAVDVWAKAQRCVIPDTACIKQVSGTLLRGGIVRFASDFPIQGNPPAGVEAGTMEDCDFAVTVYTPKREVLLCVPRILVLGIGCRKGIPVELLEERVQAVLQREGLHSAAIDKVCSIDIKQEEPGLLALCRKHGWELETFSAEQLRLVHGTFSGSGFVSETVGVDNVCERSAVLGSGGRLLVTKNAGAGVTVAVACADFHPSWNC